MPQDAPFPDASHEVALAVRELMPTLKRQALVALGIITPLPSSLPPSPPPCF